MSRTATSLADDPVHQEMASKFAARIAGKSLSREEAYLTAMDVFCDVRARNALDQRLADARQAVIDWMSAEGDAGRFRQNHQAPGWAEYARLQAEADALPG